MRIVPTLWCFRITSSCFIRRWKTRNRYNYVAHVRYPSGGASFRRPVASGPGLRAAPLGPTQVIARRTHIQCARQAPTLRAAAGAHEGLHTMPFAHMDNFQISPPADGLGPRQWTALGTKKFLRELPFEPAPSVDSRHNVAILTFRSRHKKPKWSRVSCRRFPARYGHRG